MPSLDNNTIEIVCPKCGFSNEVTFRQIRSEEVIVCRRCKVDIKLRDHMGGLQKAEDDFQKFLKNLKSLSD